MLLKHTSVQHGVFNFFITISGELKKGTSSRSNWSGGDVVTSSRSSSFLGKKTISCTYKKANLK
jgi:hypothetical protein